ncbi:MAG: hypothetical protein E6I76_10930 [Chloroflexi bacterium]|nr:MAG: hypothetical protein E6I76_10930 [Chloroflexota bacterium]
MIVEDELLTRLEDALLTGVRLVHETNLMVLGALGDSIPTLPWVDLVPMLPRLLERSFSFTSRLLELQRHYTLEYLALLGAPEPARRRSAAA